MNKDPAPLISPIPTSLLYGVVATLLISGVYLLVTATSPVCGLINIVLGGILIAGDANTTRPAPTHQQGDH